MPRATLQWCAVGVLLLFSHSAEALNCTHASPVYPSDHIPNFVGGPGPFGVVCEVKAGTPFPEPPKVPRDLNGMAFVVRSSYPGRFMETTTMPVNRHGESSSKADARHDTSISANLSSSVSCGPGGMSVASVGAAMNTKVMGIEGTFQEPSMEDIEGAEANTSLQGSSDKWLGGCVACGQTLEHEGLLKPGWFCQIGRTFGIPSGVWLKRLGDDHAVSSVQVGLTPGHEIIGFGGAFTDAVAVAHNLLDAELQAAWLDGYYGESGLGFSVGRVPFGGCDFSRRAYSLDDHEDDANLTNMCLRDDREGAKCGEDAKVPIIKKALSNEPTLKLFFSPWSAPARMKTNNKLVGGKLRGIGSGKWNAMDKRMATEWANSYVKFVDLYAQEGVTFWGLTLQNEPGADQYVTWNSASVSGLDELDLLNLVGPLMRKKYPHLKIMVHDDQVYSLKERLLDSGLLLSDFVDGVAYHWYGSLAGTFENVTAEHAVPIVPIGPAAFGGGIQVKEIFDTHIKGTGKFMLGTESCSGFVVSALHTLKDPWSRSNNRGVRPGDWHRGYRYSRDIFYQLVNGASGWTDWNLLLNSDGGPNWAGNNVDAPVLVSPDGSALWVSPMYFHLAHWAKYVVPGSKVLPVDRTSSELHEVAAFLRPDRRIVIVALCDKLDGHGDPPANQILKVSVGGLLVSLEMLSSSIVTAVFDAPSSDTDHDVYV